MAAKSTITTTVRAGIEVDEQYGAVVPPLHLSTNFTFAGYDQPRPYDYTRTGNPTRDLLGGAIAELEHGAGAVITSSGMSAVALVLELVPAGGLVVATRDCYGGSWRLLDAWARRGRFTVDFVDLTDSSARSTAFARCPSLVLLESPSNPLLRITDIAAVAAEAHQVGALVAVDNTFCSPILQRPLQLGADIVIHSTTKYLNGHSDVVGGAVVAKDQPLHKEVTWWANCIGLTGAPFDSFLTLRGLRTLAARMRIHQENAAAVVECLQQHDLVQRVYWPGLPSHPGHDIARRQQDGFGAMVSFEIAGGASAVRDFLSSLSCFSLAESLGGVESLVAHPATMTHKSMSAAARQTAGISDGLIRLSLGIEDPADLCTDLDTALNQAQNGLSSLVPAADDQREELLVTV